MDDLVFSPLPAVTLAVADSTARFPVRRVFCIGRNYAWSGAAPTPVVADPAAAPPPWFMKPADAVVPATGALPMPPGTTEFCHEVELVVAIARGGRDLDPAVIEEHHIWGYGVGLDLTRRDLQQQARRDGAPWEPGKVFDHAAPCGPLVPASRCGHPRQGAIWLRVNGQARQQGDLAALLWPVPALVAMLSRSLTLLPGDLIFTGTPDGVGPLLAGDALEAGIDGLGQVAMRVAPAVPTAA